MDNVGQVLDSIFEKLEKFLRTETVVGSPMEVGGVILIPIISVSFGLGSGGGSGKEAKGNEGSGTGGGAGCKVSPNAILVIKNQEVSVIPLQGRGSLEKLFEMAPEIISKFHPGGGEEVKEE
ncbi:MAG: sporulation protein, partial [Candidatus Syntrophonatronum acetioxidans]